MPKYIDIPGKDHTHRFIDARPHCVLDAESCHICGVNYGHVIGTAEAVHFGGRQEMSIREKREWNDMAQVYGGAGIEVPQVPVNNSARDADK